jgi:hypothetical protein
MRLVVVVERNGQVLQRRLSVGVGHPLNVVALHRFDEALGHPVALRTSDGCRDQLQADFTRERHCLVGNVAGTVVAQSLDFAVSLRRTGETIFGRLKHHVAHHVAPV